MFVNNELTERGLLHRMLRRVSEQVTTEERMAWARSIDGAIKDAASPVVPLRNDDLVISRESLDAVREFMTSGVDSPLYGRDPLAARRGADALRRLLVAAEAAQRATVSTAA